MGSVSYNAYKYVIWPLFSCTLPYGTRLKFLIKSTFIELLSKHYLSNRYNASPINSPEIFSYVIQDILHYFYPFIIPAIILTLDYLFYIINHIREVSK